MLEWKPYVANVNICSKFTTKEWRKMVTDVKSDRDWNRLVAENYPFIKCYVLYKTANSEPIAFAYILQEDDKGEVVSLHGGGWNKSLYHTLLYYQGAIMLINTLLNSGLKVRTSCLIDNMTAYRFLKSIGFVNYRSSNKWHYFWINAQRLKYSNIYTKRITDVYSNPSLKINNMQCELAD